MATRKKTAARRPAKVAARRPAKARKSPAKRKSASVWDHLHFKALQKDIKKAADMAVDDFHAAVSAVVKNHAKNA